MSTARFHLLPVRHVPVEEPYEHVLRTVQQDNEEESAAVFQVATDGSAKAGVGSFAAVLLAPYAEIDTAVVGRARVHTSSSNILAKMRAAIQGLRMALEVHRVTGMAHLVLLTDSMYVVQLLEDSIVTTRHAGPAAELLALWNRLLLTAEIEAKWVKGHSTCVLNQLADRHAREMLEAGHCRVEYCSALTGRRL